MVIVCPLVTTAETSLQMEGAFGSRCCWWMCEGARPFVSALHLFCCEARFFSIIGCW